MKVTLTSVLFLSLFLKGVSPDRVDAMEGEIVQLRCPSYIGRKHGYANLTWTNHTAQEMVLTNSPPADGKRDVSVLMHGRKLVFLSVSFSHEGNYSCSVRNTSSRVWFKLTVHKKLSRHNPEMSRFSHECHEGQSCKLICHDLYIPMLISNGTVWHKDNELLPTEHYFKRVTKNDDGVYTCTKSFLYEGRLYNMTYTVALDVLSDKSTGQLPIITSPREKQVFHIDLGSPQVIHCEAVVYSSFDEVFWLVGNSFVDVNNSLPVYYNTTREISGDQIKTTASLIFRKVSEKDLLFNYTCKLESPALFSNVTIFLAQRARPFSLFVILGTVGFIAMTFLTLSIIYMKLKIEITLFLRDTLGCHGNTSDGKSYDAYLMCYKSDTGAGLNEKDRRLLENALEDEFGYNLCLYDRDVLPGEAVADAVLGCIEQSRRVVLIPTSPDPGPGSSLLSAIHEALVERQTRLVLIRTEMKEEPHSGLQLSSSLPEALQFLGKAECSVTWKGQSSLALSSSFWKQLRYHLPAPQLLKTIAVPTDNLSKC